jgi:hypothetical protein
MSGKTPLVASAEWRDDLKRLAFSAGQRGGRPGARRPWLTPKWRARYAPAPNNIERDWKPLEAHHLAHKTQNRDDLNIAIDADIWAINSIRKLHRWPISETLLGFLIHQNDRALAWPDPRHGGRRASHGGGET